MKIYSRYCFAILYRIAKQFYFTFCFFIAINGINGQSNKGVKNFGNILNLEKVISIGIPSISDGNKLKLKAKNGFIYLLNDDFTSEKGLIFIKEHIETNKRDTTFIKIDDFMSNVNDFDVNNDNLYIFLNNQILTVNLITTLNKITEITFPTNLSYKHFLNINPDLFVFYEWQIGQGRKEEKGIYKYYLSSNKWELIDSNEINGLNFLAINKGNKYLDINEDLVVKFKPNKYEFIVKDLKSSNIDTIKRDFDSSIFISSDYIIDIHAKYQRLLKSYLFDSMDKHCFQKAQIRSARVSGDSIIYINYENKCPECEWFPGRISTRYLDIWKYDKNSHIWNLYLSDLRLDNQSICERFDVSHLTKNMLFFSLLGVETEWCVFSDLLIIPKIMSDKIDLNGDLSLSNSPESRMGSQNINIFIFKIN